MVSLINKVLLLGKNGQLGWELQRTLAPLGDIISLDWPEIDFSQPETLRSLIQTIKPSAIFNAAAYTAVDRAEAETEKCFAINARATAVLAEEAARMKIPLVHYSTDYVFDGQKGSAYVETDPAHPLNAYGQSKLSGEQQIHQIGGAYWIFRTSWVFSLRRESFVTKVLEWSRRQKSLKIVDDQVGGPTWCRMLAEISTQAFSLGGTDPGGWIQATTGLYHLAGSGSASRMEWARAILDLDPHKDQQVVTELLPTKTSEFPTPAIRPLLVPLDCSLFERTFKLRLPPWKTALGWLMEGG